MICFTDGASNSHKKRSGIGCVWFNKDQFKDPKDGKTLLPNATIQLALSKEIFGSATKAGTHPTNNEAEYISLIEALKLSIEKGIQEVTIYMDSKLVVCQVKNIWKINFPHLQELKNKVDEFKSKIKFEVFHIRREFNTHADIESKRCISEKPKTIFEKNVTQNESVSEIPKKQKSTNPFDQDWNNDTEGINPFDILMSNNKNPFF